MGGPSAISVLWHAGRVDRQTYRVTASVGGWRSLPWPFGLLDVEDDGVGIRSWHCPWWLQGRKAHANEVDGIDVGQRFGDVTLFVRVQSGRPWKVPLVNQRVRAVSDLRGRGYLPPAG
jgi:hypothetical protein